MDAHHDERFNITFDKQTGFRTKSVLCVPIHERSNKGVIGVIQAINKKNDKLFFTKDDEGLIQILSRVAESVLRNSIYQEEKVSYQNGLRSLLNCGNELNQTNSMKDLIQTGESVLEKYFDIQGVKIYYYDRQQDQLVRHSHQGRQVFDTHIGIVGQCFQKWNVISVNNSSNSTYFNTLIDINTEMPTITLPIKDDSKNSFNGYNETKIGVIQVINQKGLHNLIYSGANNSNIQRTQQLFMEQIVTFTQIFAQSAKKLILQMKQYRKFTIMQRKSNMSSELISNFKDQTVVKGTLYDIVLDYSSDEDDGNKSQEPSKKNTSDAQSKSKLLSPDYK